MKSERIKASQNRENLERELSKISVDNIIKKEIDPDKDNPNKYTKEYRRKLYKEMEEEKLKKEEEKVEKSKKSYWTDEPNKDLPSVYKDNGDIRVCNQGKYEFIIDEDYLRTGITTFELKLPKYMDTSHIKVDLNPQYVRVEAKGKLTQLKFSHEIKVEKSTIQRSQTTGHLVIKCPIEGVTTKADSSIVKKTVPTIKKELKPINQQNTVNNIEVVRDTSTIMSKPDELKVPDDVDLSEIPDLD